VRKEPGQSCSKLTGWVRSILVLWLWCAIAITCHHCNGQTVHDFGSWFSVNTQGKCNPCAENSKLRWWFDGHLRYLDDSDGFNQSIFRPGLGYQLNPNTNVWIGYAWINELPANGNPVFDENRIWQQLIWSKKVGQRALMSRSRLEQRFVETGSDMGWRFRQFCKMDRPFHEESSLSFVAWDEMFFDLNETDWGQQGSFSQNRLFVGLGKKFCGPNKPKVEIGYLNQFLRRKSADDRFNHILSVNWFWTF
jgi:hypothetical protein